MSRTCLVVEVDGQAATAEQLRHPALVNYGHFTVMQVRGARTRGLDLHLHRLDSASRELFGGGVDSDQIRHHIRHALAGTRDASVRVTVYQSDPDSALSIMVAVRPPGERRATPQSLMSVRYQRPVPHIKHAGTFAQIYYGELAERQGFSDALLVGPDGAISESASSNIAFADGNGLVWPDAPCLPGITMQLLESRLTDAGVPTRRAPVRLADVPAMAGALVTNSLGATPVDRIDGTALAVDEKLMAAVVDVYESVPWDAI